MTTSKTATVETLTAEVRVLMVGSRQVTMSVYGQLDSASHGDIEPFGRINPKDGISDRVYVVGRNVKTGELTRSSVSDNPSANLAVYYVKRTLGLDKYADVPADLIEAELAKLKKLAAEWSALPLIVLAGLR